MTEVLTPELTFGRYIYGTGTDGTQKRKLIWVSDLPLSLAPLAWYDPTDLTTLFQDAAGTVPVTADNDPVGKILDKSGNALHLTQATAGLRPLWKTSGGISRLQFDGADDALTSNSASLRIVGDLTIVAAAYYTAGNGSMLSCQTNAGTINAYEFNATVANNSLQWVDADGAGAEVKNATTSSFPANAWAVVSARRTASINLEMSVNKVRETVALTLTPTANGSSIFSIGARNGGGLGPLTGQLNNIFLFASYKATADLGSLETWTGAKVNLVI